MNRPVHYTVIWDFRPVGGFVRAACTCGWKGPLRSGPTEHPRTIAKGDARLHKRFPRD